jgi:hypothetical protein
MTTGSVPHHNGQNGHTSPGRPRRADAQPEQVASPTGAAGQSGGGASGPDLAAAEPETGASEALMDTYNG